MRDTVGNSYLYQPVSKLLALYNVSLKVTEPIGDIK